MRQVIVLRHKAGKTLNIEISGNSGYRERMILAAFVVWRFSTFGEKPASVYYFSPTMDAWIGSRKGGGSQKICCSDESPSESAWKLKRFDWSVNSLGEDLVSLSRLPREEDER